MKRLSWIILLLGIFGTNSLRANATTELTQPSMGLSVSFGNVGFFYQALSPYGEWLELEAGFHAWRPLRLRHGWRPYLHGRWAWTDYGWYWVSSEPFGWATFHYGRWFYDDYYGWVWVPDRVWGPAWVEWRYDNDYIGWAPLPPYASFSFSFGIRFTTRWIAPVQYWSFVRHRHFNSPYLTRDGVPVDHTQRLIRTTRSAGRYDVEGDRVVNRGVDRGFIERRGYTRIERVDVREATQRGERLVRDRSRQRIEVYRPDRTELERAPERIEARRADRGTSLDLQRVERQRRESPGTPGTKERSEGERRISREEFQTRHEGRSAVERRKRDEVIERRPEGQTIEVPQPRTIERREVERRSQDRTPTPKREEVIRQPERREISSDRNQGQTRREVAPPRTRVETPRAAPQPRRESPPRSDPRKRDGGRRRD